MRTEETISNQAWNKALGFQSMGQTVSSRYSLSFGISGNVLCYMSFVEPFSSTPDAKWWEFTFGTDLVCRR